MAGIAVFGGTFNPIHKGHVEMISEISHLDFIEKILVMPDNIPPHKKVECLASNNDRLIMCRLAVRGINKAFVDDRELLRQGKSYTYDTLTLLKREYKDDDIYFVCGGDMLMSLDTWYKAEELYKLCNFIAFSRSNIEKSSFNKKVIQLTASGAKIKVIDKEIKEVSSSLLREQINKKIYNKDLLCESVIDYIKQNNLYQV